MRDDTRLNVNDARGGGARLTPYIHRLAAHHPSKLSLSLRGRSAEHDMTKTPNLLQGHSFFVTFCYLPEEQIKLRSLLELNGGTVVESVQDADYVVTDTWEFEDKESVPEEASLVTVRHSVIPGLLTLMSLQRKWVEKSLVQGKMLEYVTNIYPANHRLIY